MGGRLDGDLQTRLYASAQRESFVTNCKGRRVSQTVFPVSPHLSPCDLDAPELYTGRLRWLPAPPFAVSKILRAAYNWLEFNLPARVSPVIASFNETRMYFYPPRRLTLIAPHHCMTRALQGAATDSRPRRLASALLRCTQATGYQS